IAKGGASDLYGGQALSGVAQLLTKTPEGTDASLDLSYGNERTPNASGYLGHSFGKWLASGAAEYFRTDGYIPVEFSQRGAVDNNANSLHRNGQLEVQREFSQRSRFFLSGLGYDDSRHNGTIIEVNRTRAWQTVNGFSRTVALPSGATAPTQFADRSETAWNPKLATTFRVNDRVALKGSAYRSFRSPTLNELYRSFRLGNTLTTANPFLRSE